MQKQVAGAQKVFASSLSPSHNFLIFPIPTFIQKFRSSKNTETHSSSLLCASMCFHAGCNYLVSIKIQANILPMFNRVSLMWRDIMTQETLIESVHYYIGMKHGSIQVEEVLRKELIGLYLRLKATRRKLVATGSKEEDRFSSLGRHCALHKSKPKHWYTSSNKSTPCNSATSHGQKIF